MAGRFPGADSIEELWLVLCSGGDCIDAIPTDRMRWKDEYDPSQTRPYTMYVNRGGYFGTWKPSTRNASG